MIHVVVHEMLLLAISTRKTKESQIRNLKNQYCQELAPDAVDIVQSSCMFWYVSFYTSCIFLFAYLL